MATQRYISTSFWTDKWVRSLDPSERYLYMYLLTNPQTNIAGIYQITLDRIAFDTGYDERTLPVIFKRFEKDKKAFYYNEEWVIISSWPKHQKADSKSKIRSGIDTILKSIPDDVKNYAVSIGYQYNIEGYPYQPNYSDLNSDINSNSDRDINTPAVSQLPDTHNSQNQEQPERHMYKDTECDGFITFANSTCAFPEERRKLFNMPNPGEIQTSFSFYSKDEIKQAFVNYAKIKNDPDLYRMTPYKSLVNFIVKNGISKFIDSAKPFDSYARGQPQSRGFTDDDIQTDFE